MTRRLASSSHAVRLGLAGALGLTLLPACEETGAVHDDAAVSQDDAWVDPTTDSGPLPDGGPPGTPQITYTPTGCDYMVSTPEVNDAAMGSDVFGAMPAPDHVHVSIAGPAVSSFAVNWRTDRDTLASSLLYGTDRDAVTAADDATTGVTRQDGHTMRYMQRGGGAGTVTRVHEAHVCGLAAGTRYFYKVGGPGHWSDVYEVSTSPAIGTTEPWSFAVTGDSRGNEDNAWAIAQREILEAGVDLQIFSGDAVLLGNVQSQWNEEFFEPSVPESAFEMSDSLAQIPLMMANGNHDVLALPYLAQFAFPQEASPGETSQGEEWYSFDYGNAHFVFLNDTVFDGGVIAGAERDWLAEDLRRADMNRANVPWIFVVHHQPLYTCLSTHAPAVSLRSAWQSLFDQYHVDVVWAGHNHVYERSRPIHGADGTVAAVGGSNYEPQITDGTPSGTVYVVAAGVGAPLYAVQSTCPFSAPVGQAVRNYVRVQITGTTLEATVYDALAGTVIDSFTWTK
ncbi:MAG: metallophosphoesterase family protein [Sandaracinaceae bacterium]|nr:metallophosphoesterase family protein [Sandaracinaceae bacterium]